MATNGDPCNFRDLFPDDLIPDILELVVRAWEKFTKPASSENEVPITKDFCLLLQRLKNSTSLPFKIRWEVPLLDSTTDKSPGRADLIFDYLDTQREEVYFLFECKCLCVPSTSRWKSLAGDYVGADGMMRFVSGKYSADLPAGGMIGYVMDGKVQVAISKVAEAIMNNRVGLHLKTNTGLETCEFMPSNKTVKETSHDLSTRIYMLYHIFLRV